MRSTPATQPPPRIPTPETAKPPLRSLTNDEAKEVLAADIVNILKKVKRGETLSNFQRGLIAKSAAGERAADPVAKGYAKTQSELADLLGISRQALAYQAKKPNAWIATIRIHR